MSRADVVVVITLYTPDASKDDAVFELRDKRGALIEKVSGRFCWHPAMNSRKNKYGGFDPGTYPSYSVIRTARGTEVLEHREAGPVLYISDDEILRRQVMEGAACDKG